MRSAAIGGAVARFPAAPKKRKVQNRPEEGVHRAIAEYLSLIAPRDNPGAPFIWHHSPNQRGTRSKWENELLKALGVLAGFPDIIILGPGGNAYFGEIKSARGTQSDNQRKFEKTARHLGFRYDIWRSVEECCQSLKAWGLIRHG